MFEINSVEDAQRLEGQEVGLSDWVLIDRDKILRFAEATGDYQWIHVDTDRAAAELPDGKTIAHGYLTLALIPALTDGFITMPKLQRAINRGCNRIRFNAPVPVGSRVRARASITKASLRAGAIHLVSEVRIEVEGVKKPACTAEIIGLYFLDD